jgi:DNA polymerase-3 subunit delta'
MSWKQVQGRDDVIAAFSRAAGRGRLAHAYLFVGPEGVGKSSFARELAKALLCDSAPPGRLEACDRCAACKLVDAGTHPDLFAVRRPEDKQEFPIAVVRELCANLAMKPARGRRKIAIVQDAEDFNDESANCFLKTLEEPPPGSLLVVLATSAESQLPTIRSRCQVVRFGPLPPATVRGLLARDENLNAEAVERLVGLGDAGPARELGEPEPWTIRGELLTEMVRARPVGPPIAKRLWEWVEAAGKDSGAQRRRASAFVKLLADGLRKAVEVSVSGSVPDSATDPAIQGAARLRPKELLLRLDRVIDADVQIDRRVQLVLVIEGLVDGLLQPSGVSPS